MNANQQQEKFLQLEEKQKSMSSEIERLESMIIDMKRSRRGSKDGHDDEALEDFMATPKTLEEFDALNQTLHKLRHHHGGKEGLNERIVDENVELERRIDEMGKKLEAKEGELKDLESLNQALMVMVHKSNNEILETQEELDSGGKEKSNKKVVQLEKMLIISRNENFALKRKIDEMKKCMEEKEAEVKDLESFNQLIMARERKNNDENQEAREELINSMQGLPGCVNIGVKRLGELDLASFAAAVKKRKCSGSGPHKAGLEQDSGVEATLLCSLWEKHLEDPGWHPFKMATVGDKYQEVIDDEDPKLKDLKSQLGEDAYKVVTTSLLEMNEYNLSSRRPVSEIWNFKEGRKASLKEGFGFVFEKLKNLGECVVSGPSIGATNRIPSASLHLNPCKIPDTEFHDFMADKSYWMFRSGQIWAMYCSFDGMPRYYVQIIEVIFKPNFELHVQDLDFYSPMCKIRCADKNMPICCGMFKLGETEVHKKIKGYFSHRICAKLVEEKNCEIYPRRGEVWALYKYFDSKWTCSALKNCKYDIVEVLGDNDSKFEVLVLEQVIGFKTVFKPKKNSGVDHTVGEITEANLLTFSHQIPAFRLTDEKEGSLRDYWELDPNSIPVNFFSSN